MSKKNNRRAAPMARSVYTYNDKRGPSGKTIGIIIAAIVAAAAIACGVFFGVRSANQKKAEQSEKPAVTASQETQEKKAASSEENAAPAEEPTPVVDHVTAMKKGYNMPYAIAVNTAQNVITVYTKDEETGKYTKPYKAFICSTGVGGEDATDSGTWYTMEHTPHWWNLDGGVKGQYCTRIHDHILFHSVPYTEEDPGKLQEGEYNKLGTAASHGCIRMRVADVKWIYDNCDMGTCVNIYKDSKCKEPLGKPSYTKVPSDPSDPRHGWDPTDPSPKNPWKTPTTTAKHHFWNK